MPELFHVNGFRRAGVNTGFAVYTHILIHFRLLVLHGNCRGRAFIHAGFASGTSLFINDCYQLVHSIVYISQKTKNRFRCYTVFDLKKT